MIEKDNERVLLRHQDQALEKLEPVISEENSVLNLSDLLGEFIGEFRKKKQPKKLNKMNSTNLESETENDMNNTNMQYEEELDEESSASEVEVDDYFRRQDSNLGKKVKKSQPEFLQLKTLKAQRSYKRDLLRREDFQSMNDMTKQLKRLREQENQSKKKKTTEDLSQKQPKEGGRQRHQTVH